VDIETLNKTTWEDLNSDWLEHGNLTDRFAKSQFENCPSCGTIDHLEVVNTSYDEQGAAVLCRPCQWQVNGEFPSEAVENWNKRHSEPATTPATQAGNQLSQTPNDPESDRDTLVLKHMNHLKARVGKDGYLSNLVCNTRNRYLGYHADEDRFTSKEVQWLVEGFTVEIESLRTRLAEAEALIEELRIVGECLVSSMETGMNPDLRIDAKTALRKAVIYRVHHPSLTENKILD
jgi:hypothetical protein